MTGGWQGSDRQERLPANWPKLVAATKARAGGRCQARLPSGKRCPRAGSQCDHKQHGDVHELWNLQWLCAHHHGKKSAREGNQARWALRKKVKRTAEGHPGRLT